MKNKGLTISLSAMILLLVIAVTGCKCDKNNDKNYCIENNMIVFDEPQRVEGQTTMLESLW